MRSSKAQILSRVHTVPALRFTDQTLTSASGLVLFQVLFDRLDLRSRVRQACRHVRSVGDFQLPELFLTLVIHIILGYRELDDVKFYSEDTALLMEELETEYTASVPFLRLPELKGMIERCQRWCRIDETWSCFEAQWKPKKWLHPVRFVFVRQPSAKRRSRRTWTTFRCAVGPEISSICWPRWWRTT